MEDLVNEVEIILVVNILDINNDLFSINKVKMVIVKFKNGKVIGID